MKGKANSIIWSVTVFMVGYFLQPGLLVQACVPNPTNYWQFAEGRIVPVNQVTNLVPANPPEVVTTQSDKPKVWGLAIAFIIAIIVIGYIISQIIRMLDKVIPPPDKPAPPPPVSGDTNHPPIVFNPSGRPGPAVTGLVHAKTMIYTNLGSWGGVNYYDITAYDYKNTYEHFATPPTFDRFWSVRMMTTTNLLDWEDSNYRIDAMITTSVGVLYCYYHCGTNYYNCYYNHDYVASNGVAPAYFDLTDKPYQPNQFFRLDPR